jgi:eukaryotic-like serine/threonine-protein kinase
MSVVGSRFGHYEIRSQLGVGGMGEVYLAQDINLSRQVALKLLPSKFTEDESRVRRFQQEARAASALNHPNILTIHEIGSENGTYFIATEYIEGQTLRDYMSGAKMRMFEVLDVATQVASALAAAHAAGVVHRDIKPENIMLRQDRIVKVLDFGLAKLTEAPTTDTEAATLVNTEAGVVMGTARYMSPEQVRGLAVDARTDVWSLGVVIHEMLTGRVPFKGETASDVIAAVLEREPQPLMTQGEEIPIELKRIVSKALRKDPEERYQTIRDMLIDLKSLKQELELDAKSKRSTQSQLEGAAATSIEQTTTAKQEMAAPTSSAQYLVGEIKRHRLGVGMILATLLVAIAAVAYFAYFPRADKVPITSIAVLPFENKSADPDTDYLSDGLTESLIYRLSQLPNLKVSPRSSVFRYKGRETDPIKVGGDLGVSAVLSGRITQRGDYLIISAELTDVRYNKLLWGEQYERRMSDLLATQREIAREIVEKLKLKVSGEERGLAKHYTESNEAYQNYLKGRFYWNKRNAEALKKSTEYFNQAIEHDPNYAMAYAGLADAYILLPFVSGGSPQECYPKAKAAAKKALEIDDTLAEAHASLALTLIVNDWDWAGSSREFRRALELNPNYATAHQWYGTHYLTVVERFDEAIAEGKQAEQLDPLSLVIKTDLGSSYTFARQYDTAIEQLRKTIEMDQSFYVAHWRLGTAYEMKGSFQEAIAEYQKAGKLNDDPQMQALLGHAYAASGKRDEALRTLDQLKEISEKRYVSAYAFAIIYAGLGEKDQALQWLEQAYQNHDWMMARLKIDPLLDNLRSDPRFQNIVRRVGIPS